MSTDEHSAARADYYDRLGEQSLAPLWEVLHKLLARTPAPRATAHLWRYDAVRPFVIESGDVISAREAERRVLVLENPTLRGQSQVTDTLYAGLQLILPGEVAPAHRHTPSALRLIVEGAGAYTAVDGEKTFMSEGDFIITPSWGWHDHGHEGEGPMVWLDGLDLPIVHFLAATFAEAYPAERFPSNVAPGTARARYGAGMKPVGDRHEGLTSPLFSYPYTETRAALERLRSAGDVDSVAGIKLEYLNPLDGGPAMPTMSTYMQWLPARFRGAPARATDHAVYSVVEGRGRLVVGQGEAARTLEWGPKDHFVVPGWSVHRFEAVEDCVLFSFSDRVVQEKLGLWREQRLADQLADQ